MAVAEPQPPEPPGLRLVGDDRYPSWEEVYRDNAEWVYRLMFGRVGNRPDAEDLTTEVFLTALPRLRMDSARPEVRAYLVATARTALASHWRRTLGREITGIGLDERPEDPAAPAPNQQREQHVRAILDELPERYRRILELRFLQAYSIKEAAAELGISVANAKVLQHRALKRATELGREV